MIQAIFDSRSTASRKFHKSRRQAFRRLLDYRPEWSAIELERRALLATVTWTGGGGNLLWNVAANWSGGTGVPTSADEVVIPDLPGDQTIVSNTSATIRSIDSREGIAVTGGTFSLTAGTSLVDGPFSIASGCAMAVSGAGTTLTAANTLTVSGATISASNGSTVELRNLTSASGSMLRADYGGTLNLPDLVNVTGCNFGANWDGDGYQRASRLSVPKLTGTTGGTGYRALDGGIIDSPALTNLDNDNVWIRGATATMYLQGVTALNSSYIHLDDATAITSLALTSMTASALQLTSSPITSLAITAMEGSWIASYYSTDVTLPSLTTASNSSFHAYYGGKLNLPELVHMTGGNFGANWDGDGNQRASRLYLPKLEGTTGGTNYRILDGGIFDSPALTNLDNDNVWIRGATATMNLQGVTALNSSSIHLDDATAITSLALTSMTVSGLQLTSSPITSLAITAMEGSWIASYYSSEVTLPSLTTASNSAFYATYGGKLNLPELVHMTGGNFGANWDGDGNQRASRLYLPKLVSQSGTTQFRALDKGEIQLGVSQFTLTGGSSNIWIRNGGEFAGDVILKSGAHLYNHQDNGTARFKGNVVNDGGMIYPGAGPINPGRLTIEGNYTQTSLGILQIDLNGTTPGSEYDQLIVTGTATLAGRLNVSVSGYAPAVGDVFQILQAGSVAGDFEISSLPTFASGVKLIESTGSTNVTLTTVPAPAVAVADAFNDEGDSAVAGSMRNMAFVISGVAPAGGATINYATAGGSPGVDYVTTSGSFSVPAGAYSQTINVPIRGNLVLQGSRTFRLEASASGTSTVSGAGLIYDDDAPVSITLANTTASTSVNTPFTPALTATLRNRNNALVEGATVRLTVGAAGGASATFAGGAATTTAVSNTSGVVTVPVLTANGTVGGPYGLMFEGLNWGDSVASTATMNLSNSAAVATSLAIVSGSGQSATVNTPFGGPLKVKALDSGGNGVAGVTITFAAPGSGASGSFAGGVVTEITGADGVATSPVFTANTLVGTYSVSASTAGLSSVNFSLSNSPGAAASVAYVSGGGQYASVGTDYLQPLMALVRDAFGNVVPGVTVTFEAPATGASVAFAGGANTAVTGADGLATSAGMRATVQAGRFVVTGKVEGVSTGASFAIENTDGPVLLNLTPTGLTNQTVSTLRAVFSEPIDSATFTGEDVKITLPGGGTIPFASVTVTPVSGTNGTEFDIAFPAQSADGTYGVEVGPYIWGVAGKMMSPTQQTAIYSNDFESAAGPAWSTSNMDTAPGNGTKFLGQFGNDTVRLSLTNLPAYSTMITLSFDLYIINTWDGQGPAAGPDYWGSKVVGQSSPLLYATFNNMDSSNQYGAQGQSFGGQNSPPGTYPSRTGYFAKDTLLFPQRDQWGERDTTYRLTFSLMSTGPNMQFDFYGAGLQQLNDESWGLDNVVVTAAAATNGGAASSFTIDKTSPGVTTVSPSSTLNTTVSSLDITFSEIIRNSTLSAGDIELKDPLGNVVPVSGPAWVSGNTYRFSFAPQRANGIYSVKIGPNVLDLAGNAMTAAADRSFTVSLADLVHTVTPTVSAATPKFGDTIDVSWTLKNLGTLATPASWTDWVYLSNDDAWSADDVLLGNYVHTAGALAPDGTRTISLPVTLPVRSDLAAGNYRLIVVADAAAGIVESNEGNNAAASAAVTITAPPLPDLSVSGVTGPTTMLPGSTVALSWLVSNTGAAAATGVWVERVYLSRDAAIGGDLLLAAFGRTGQDIAVGGTASRTNQQVTIPANLEPGDWRFVVEVDGGSELAEADETNNFAIAATLTNVPVRLTVTASAQSVVEGASPITGRVTRSGNIAQPLVVTLTSADTTEATVPVTVTIPAGFLWAEFPITPVQDDLLDGNVSVRITAKALDGNGAPLAGFVEGSTDVTVVDSASPTLGLTLLTATVREGQSVTARLTRLAATIGSSIVVSLEASLANQLSMPVTVTIPAGSLSADFTITGIADGKLEITRVISITATGPAVATADLTLEDADNAAMVVTTDLPGVAENASGVATFGTVRRLTPTDRPLVVKLTTDSGRLTIPATVTIPAGATSARFGISAVDNNVSGDTKNIVIQALALDAVDGTSTVAPGGSAVLTIYDDDAPGLTVTIRDILISEGDNVPPRQNIPAAIGVVRRNSADTSQPLVATLTSSDTTEATVQPTVTIPAGASSAEFGIYAVLDFITDGTQQVTIMASAAGMNAGSAVISVSDIDKADLRVPSVNAPATAWTGQSAGFTYNLFNQGTLPVPEGFVDRIYLSDDAILDLSKDRLVASRTQTAAIGAQTEIGLGLSIPVPQDLAGRYYVLVQTDALKVVDEVFEENNVGYSATPIMISASYSATVAVSTSQAPMGSSITLTGKAIPAAAGLSVANVPVAIRIRHDSGVRRVITAMTDADGNYTATFRPLAGEAGVYTVAADHPAVIADVPQATFKLLGMKTSPDALAARVIDGETVTGTFDVTNRTDVPLTNLAWTVIGAPASLQVTVTPPSLATLAGNGTAAFTWSVKALNASVPTANFTIRLTTAEGAVLDVPATVRVDPLTARLTAPARVSSPMLPDALRVVEFEISNPSGLATGPIRMLLPTGVSWLSVANAAKVDGVPVLPGVPANGTATVTLLLNPGAAQPLGAYSGSFVMVPESGPSVSVNYEFRAVSVAKGGIDVQVYNELQNQQTGLPFAVPNATVELLDVFTGEVVRTATTDSLGKVAFAEVVEGFYNLIVQAENHDSSLGTVEIKADMTTGQTVILRSRQVSYNWTVVQVPFEDRYTVQIETVFTTNVPAPVITITPNVIDLADPKFADGWEQIDFVIANHGLVAAQDMVFRFDTHPKWKITPLVEEIGQLPARSELVMPVIVELIGDEDECSGICSFSGALTWNVVSFGREIPFTLPIPVLNADDCCGLPNQWIWGWGGGGGGGGGEVVLVPIAIPPTFRFETPIEIDAEVRVRLDQQVVMTRSAFDATLEISNGLNVPLEGLQVQLIVQAAGTGDDALGRFAIGGPVLSNITTDSSGFWSVPARAAGKSTWKLLPNDLAAPLQDTVYLVGGTFSYLLNGQRVVQRLTPAPITVKPDAALNLKYFRQVNVYSDDPWTPEQEPSIPFDLGLMITNAGAGAARDLTITSAQPKIVENEKGLLIDFVIDDVSVNGQPAEKSLQAHFGDVEPGATEIGLWRLSTTLQGQFTDFEATFQHLTGLGDPRTSLIKSVSTYDLIKTVSDSRAGADTLPDFLTDELPDPGHTPDAIHLSNGLVRPVGLGQAVTTPVSPRPGALAVAFTASMPDGFGYLRIADPNPDRSAYRLLGVKRADGSLIPAGTNVWTTDRTFTVPFQRPIVENTIHIFDEVGSASYTLVYGSTDETGPSVAGISEVVPNPTTAAIGSLTITFHEAIDPTNFALADLAFFVNGTATALTGASLVAVDSSNTAFRLEGLTGLTGTDGEYRLSVDAAGVNDIWGNAGTGVAERIWTKAANAPAVAFVSGLPTGPTRTAPFRVTVEFDRDITAGSFGIEDLSLTRDDGANLITPQAGVTITRLDARTFEFYLPVDLTQPEGQYRMAISATGVTDTAGTAGVGAARFAWALDRTAPVLLPLEPVATNPRNIVVQSMRVVFSEPIVPSSFDISKVKLTRGVSSTNLLDFRASIRQLSPAEFLLEGINWPQSSDGRYTLSVDSAGILDPAGNVATGSQSVSWVIDLVKPLPPGNFRITPDNGVSATDLITNTGEITILGKTAETGGRVKFEDDLTGQSLGYVLIGNSLDFAFPATLSTGAHRIKAIHVDEAGNFSEIAEFLIIVDQAVPGAQWNLPARENPVSIFDSVNLNFTEAVRNGSVSVESLKLTRDGVPLDTSGLVIEPVEASGYRISGIAALTTITGAYRFTIDTSKVDDLAGNAGQSVVASDWLIQVPGSLAIVSGSGQTATTLAAFGTPLRVRLTDTAGVPIKGVTVTFDAPVSGASVTFAGGVRTAVTDDDGYATSAAITANGTGGLFQISASVAGLPAAWFDLRNLVFGIVDSRLDDLSSLTVRFNLPVATTNLNVSDTVANSSVTELADFRITDSSGNRVPGSLIVASDGLSATFVKTGGGFADGTYSLTLRSAANGFRSATGTLMDGNDDGTPGGDYVRSFTVASGSSRSVSIPDLVRGPGQDLRVSPSVAGLPVIVRDTADVYRFEMTLNYDPQRIVVTGVVVPPDLASTLAISYTIVSPGTLRFVGTATAGLPSGRRTVALIQGTVPNDAPYRSKSRLNLAEARFVKTDGTSISSVIDDGIALVNYPGDVTGDGRYNALDVVRAQRYLVNLDSWFPQYSLVDPVLAADVNVDGRVNGLDPLLMQRYLVNLAVNFLTPPPVANVAQAGLDPVIFIPRDLSAKPGQVLAVPVMLTNTDSQSITVGSFEIVVSMDPRTFAFNRRAFESRSMTVRYDARQGLAVIAGIMPEKPLAPGETMTLTTLNLRVSPRASAVEHALNLMDEARFGHDHYRTSANGGTLVLIPAPTDRSDDPVDGRVRIVPAGANRKTPVDPSSETLSRKRVATAASLRNIARATARRLPRMTPKTL